MKVISVVNQKGGCGKTTTAVNLSAGLSKKGYRVLLIDLDPQAHATFSLRKEGNFTITDVLERVCASDEFSAEGMWLSVSENFYFIPSRIGLASLEHKLALRDDKLSILSCFLKKVPGDFEYVIIDCPPNLGILTLNALEASEYSLIPLSVCDLSLKGLETLKNIIIMLKEFKEKAPTPFYLLTQVDKRSKFSQEFIERVKNQMGNLLLSTTIRTNIYLKEAVFKGKTIFEHKPDSRGAQDFMNLAEEIKNITTQTRWTPLFLK
jgi:chromosome partitioning protein